MHVLIFMMNSSNRSRCSQINMIQILPDQQSTLKSTLNTLSKDNSKTKKISSTLRGRKSFFLIPLLTVLLLNACKEPDAVGLNVLPGSDQLGLEFSDSATIYSKTVREDSLRTDEISLQLLGSIY